MHLGPRPSVLLATTLVGVLLSVQASAQDAPATEAESPQQIDQLVADLEARAQSLAELQKTVDESPSSAASLVTARELSERRNRYRGDVAKLVDAVVVAEEEGRSVESARAAATRILETDARTLLEKWEARSSQAGDLFDAAEKGTGEDSWTARRELANEVPRTSRVVSYYDDNLKQRQKLGLDVSADTEAFTKRLRVRGDIIASVLKNTKEQIDEIASRPGADQDAAAQKELSALKRQRDVLADAQRLNVGLMDSYGLDTADLRREIITATGKVSEDILDKDVAKGLFSDWLGGVADWFRTNAAALFFQFIVFVLILFLAWLVAKLARAAVRRGLERSKLSVSSLARDFFIKTAGRLIILFGLIIALAQLGIEVGPLLAGLGIAGFILGFALQDTLSNFAAGLMILVYRPFDIGDVVEAGGVTGKVDKMNLVSTQILTFDNQLLIVPNKQVWGGIIRNVTHQDKRRVDLTFGIGYADDVPKAEKVLTEIIESHDKVLKDPEPVVKLHTLGESSVDFIVRPWTKTDDYWEVYWYVTSEVKRRFDAEGISIPFPQRDVHVYETRSKDE